MGHLYLPKQFLLEEVYSYSVARIARVYPLFFLVVVGSGVIAAVRHDVGPFGLTLADVPSHLAFAGSATTIWTISVEFQFSLCSS